jgi:hypothetical protein
MTLESPPAPGRRGSRTRRALKITAWVAGTVVVLCCVGSTAFVGFAVYDTSKAPQREAEIHQMADGLARHLEARQHDAVYDYLSAGAHRRYSREVCVRGLDGLPMPVEHGIDRLSASFLLTYVTIRLIYSDRHSEAHTFDVIKEGDVWKVDSDLLGDLTTGPRHGGGGGWD